MRGSYYYYQYIHQTHSNSLYRLSCTTTPTTDNIIDAKTNIGVKNESTSVTSQATSASAYQTTTLSVIETNGATSTETTETTIRHNATTSDLIPSVPTTSAPTVSFSSISTSSYTANMSTTTGSSSSSTATFVNTVKTNATGTTSANFSTDTPIVSGNMVLIFSCKYAIFNLMTKKHFLIACLFYFSRRYMFSGDPEN